MTTKSVCRRYIFSSAVKLRVLAARGIGGAGVALMLASCSLLSPRESTGTPDLPPSASAGGDSAALPAASATDGVQAAGAGSLVTDLGQKTVPTVPAEVNDDYQIAPTDVLEITVFQEDDLKSVLRVSRQGTVSFPLIGAVKVGGLTTQEAAHVIQGRLARGYLIDPQVSVTVTEFAKREFTVLGEVQRPGSYDIPDQQKVTVLEAIAIAGGYTRIANPGQVTLMRKVDGRPKIFDLNARKMARGDEQSAFEVFPGDVITVAESRF